MSQFLYVHYLSVKFNDFDGGGQFCTINIFFTGVSVCAGPIPEGSH